jgi:hypothetical protein
MSKTLLSAAFVMATLGGVEGKVRPLYPPLDTYEAHPVVKSHERKVREPLAQSFPVQVGNGESATPVVEAGTSTKQCLFQDDQNEWCF